MADTLFLSVPELAAALGVSVSTVHEWTRQVGPQSVPRYRIGRGYKFLLPEVIAWVRAERDGRGLALSAGRRGRVLPAARTVRRRAPPRQGGSQRGANAVRTRVSGDGPAAVALGVPSDG